MILGGTVRFEDGIKSTPGDTFSPTRKVAVELNFAVPEDPGVDPDSVVAEVLEKAISLVNSKLGIAASTPRAKSTVVQTTAPAVAGKTKADLEAEVTAKVDKPATAKRGPKPRASEADASAVVDTPIADAAAVTDEWASEPVTEITDKDMNDAVQKKNLALKDPVKIRQLIGSFNPDPKKAFTLREIPQTSRATFVEKLVALA